MRMTPEGAPTNEHRVLAKRMDNSCFEKAKARGQQTFTLVEQDASAARTILFWIMENLGKTPVEKLRDAFEDCLAFQYSNVTKKNPD